MENEKPYSSPGSAPNKESLISILAETYPFFEGLLELSNSFKNQWHFYKSSGWLLKVFDSKKALFYLVPMFSSFKISLTIRETEKEEFLLDFGLAAFHETMRNAKKYPEGFALQFIIYDKDSFLLANLLIEKIIEKRGQKKK